MFREMRRSRQQLTPEESIRLLEQGTVGVLGLLGDDGYPYTLPISYLYRDGRLYFHSAKAGHKLDAIRRQNKASFTVVGRSDTLPEKFTACYQSVIAFGQIRVLEEEAEKREAIRLLTLKYCPGEAARMDDEIDRAWAALCMLEFSIQHLTGKQSKELVK